ncbi:MAG: glycosyltransferase family 2 protein [Gemmatimonadales bacterium]
MPARPVVSVVIIFLNPGPFLEEAIESVRRQTFRDWELLLVDDGSGDGSSEVARQAADAEPHRIRYLEHEEHANRGMSASRNLGCLRARGAYITFLDADDMLRPEALETLLSTLRTAPRAAMAYGPVEYWYSWAGERAARADFVQRLGVAAPALLEPPSLLLRFLRRQAAAPSGMLVRAEVIREVRGFEDAFRGMYEDQAFCAKVCLRRPVVTTAKCVYRYRQHPGSSSSRADRSGEPDFGRTAFLQWLGGYLGREGNEDLTVRDALRRELWWARHPRLHGLVRRARRLRRKLTGRLRPRRSPRPARA